MNEHGILISGGDAAACVLDCGSGVAVQRFSEMAVEGRIAERGFGMSLYQLLLLNLVLQMFDGVATYSGMSAGFEEGNPLLRMSFAFWGIGPTLLLSKAISCALLMVLYRRPGGTIVARGFGVLAAVYCIGSLFPWLATFVGLFSGWF